MKDDTKKPADGKAQDAGTGGQALLQKRPAPGADAPAQKPLREISDPIVVAAREQGLFGKPLPDIQAETIIQKPEKAIGDKAATAEERQQARSRAIMESSAACLVDAALQSTDYRKDRGKIEPHKKMLDSFIDIALMHGTGSTAVMLIMHDRAASNLDDGPSKLETKLKRAVDELIERDPGGFLGKLGEKLPEIANPGFSGPIDYVLRAVEAHYDTLDKADEFAHFVKDFTRLGIDSPSANYHSYYALIGKMSKSHPDIVLEEVLFECENPKEGNARSWSNEKMDRTFRILETCQANFTASPKYGQLQDALIALSHRVEICGSALSALAKVAVERPRDFIAHATERLKQQPSLWDYTVLLNSIRISMGTLKNADNFDGLFDTLMGFMGRSSEETEYAKVLRELIATNPERFITKILPFMTNYTKQKPKGERSGSEERVVEDLEKFLLIFCEPAYSAALQGAPSYDLLADALVALQPVLPSDTEVNEAYILVLQAIAQKQKADADLLEHL